MRLLRPPLTVLVLTLSLLCPLISAWSAQDHEIFRIRDEVALYEGLNATFYSFLGVSPTATLDEINKAYRKKSRLLHPDKAKAAFVANYAKQHKGDSKKKDKTDRKQRGKKTKKPGVHVSKGPSQHEIAAATKAASERFARLGIVTNILRGPLRDRYDYFLKNGFPRWRGTGYYYSRFRPGLGSVLLGLFVFGGGAVHYAVLTLGWRQRREFVDRYIRHARRSAWGDETGIRGISGLGDTSAVVAPQTMQSDEARQQQQQQQHMTRKQRRFAEREARKEEKKNRNSGKATPPPQEETVGHVESVGVDKKRVVAENGKVLIVDSVGNVYLEDVDEDGNVGEYLLDPDELPKPTVKDTALWRFPVWIWKKSVGRIVAGKEGVEEGEETEDKDGGESSGDSGDSGDSSTGTGNGIETPSSDDEDSEVVLVSKSEGRGERRSDGNDSGRVRRRAKRGKKA